MVSPEPKEYKSKPLAASSDWRTIFRLPWYAWVIVIVAAIIRIFPINADFSHPDEDKVNYNAIQFARHSPLQWNPSIYYYSMLYPHLLVPAYAVLDPFLDEQELNAFGRVCTGLFGTLGVWLLMIAANLLFGTRVALASGLLLTVYYLHSSDSHYLTTDVPVATMVTLVLLLSVLAIQRKSFRLLLWAAFVAGLAAATKYTGIISLLIVIGAYLRVAQVKMISWKSAANLALLLAIGIAGLLVASPYPLKHPWQFVLGVFQNTTWSLWNQDSFIEAYLGFGRFRAPLGAFWPVIILALGGCVGLWRDEKPLRGLLFLFPAVFLLVLAGNGFKAVRFALPLAPFISLFAGWAAVSLVQRLQPHWRCWGNRAFLLLCACSLAYCAWWNIIAMRPDPMRLAHEWVVRQSPGEAILLRQEQNDIGRLYAQVRYWRFRTQIREIPGIGRYFAGSTVDKHRQELAEAEYNYRAYYVPDVEETIANGSRYVLWKDTSRFPEPLGPFTPEVSTRVEMFYRRVLATEPVFVVPRNANHPWGMGFADKPRVELYDLHHVAAAR